jgi:hypothetical protein
MAAVAHVQRKAGHANDAYRAYNQSLQVVFFSTFPTTKLSSVGS